ncbi:RNA chaperone Hfq [Ideonella sp.]|uniref:RNA chaperone Hfq n=1 Tax=Ideonella sp. TaxID=1929293 RepID=UPI0035B105EB
MRNQPLSAQEPYLDQLCRDQADVTVYLLNGVRLSGRLTHFDNHALLLSDRLASQLVYKHSVSTIVPFAGLRRGRAVPNP